MRPLVILRPEPGSSASGQRAEALGLEIMKLPLFELRPLPWTAPEPGAFDALLLTSANAVRFGGGELDKLKALPVYAVGGATAEAARSAGFEVIGVGGGGVAELAIPAVRLLRLAGRHHRALEQAHTIAVYESAELPPPAALSELSDAVVAVHSARAGRRLADIIEERSSIAVAAISQAAADACGTGWASVDVAETPADSALLALAARLCDKA